MERVGFVLRVRADRLTEYRERHRSVWPELLSSLREGGWRNYTLFLRPDGLLFGYLETESFERALSEMGRRDVNARWQREMAPFFEGTEGRPADRALERLDEIFHLA